MEKWALGLAPVALALLILAIPQAGRWLSVARWVAIALACVLVGFHLLPEAFSELSWLVAVPFAIGLLGPTAVERLSGIDHEHEHGAAHHIHHDHAHEHGHGSLNLGLVGLGLHQLFDGLQIGLVHDVLGSQATVAIGMHGAPLVAAFVLTCRKAAGTRYALSRGALLVVLTAVGIAVAGAVPEALVEPVEPWLAAFVGGVLLHVVVHDA